MIKERELRKFNASSKRSVNESLCYCVVWVILVDLV